MEWTVHGVHRSGRRSRRRGPGRSAQASSWILLRFGRLGYTDNVSAQARSRQSLLMFVDMAHHSLSERIAARKMEGKSAADTGMDPELYLASRAGAYSQLGEMRRRVELLGAAHGEGACKSLAPRLRILGGRSDIDYFHITAAFVGDCKKLSDPKRPRPQTAGANGAALAAAGTEKIRILSDAFLSDWRAEVWVERRHRSFRLATSRRKEDNRQSTGTVRCCLACTAGAESLLEAPRPLHRPSLTHIFDTSIHPLLDICAGCARRTHLLWQFLSHNSPPSAAQRAPPSLPVAPALRLHWTRRSRLLLWIRRRPQPRGKSRRDFSPSIHLRSCCRILSTSPIAGIYPLDILPSSTSPPHLFFTLPPPWLAYQGPWPELSGA